MISVDRKSSLNQIIKKVLGDDLKNIDQVRSIGYQKFYP